MCIRDRVELSEEMHRKGLQFYTYQPTSMGYEGALMDLWNKELSYDEFRQKVKDLKEMNTDWYDLLFRTSVSHQHSIAAVSYTHLASAAVAAVTS